MSEREKEKIWMKQNKNDWTLRPEEPREEDTRGLWEK